MRQVPRFALCLATAFGLLVWAAVPGLTQDGGTETLLRPAKLYQVDGADNGESRSFYGRVRARETVDLAFQVSGQIEQLPIVEGATLEKGELVAQLDLTPFRRAVERAEVNLAKAERDLARVSDLSRDAIPEVEVRNTETTRDLAQIDLEEARRQLEQATLTAPFEALVASRQAVNYATVNAGTPVARLHDMSELRVDIDVPEVLFTRAAGDRGAAIDFTAAFPGISGDYPLVLREYEAESADVGQTYRLTLALTGDVPGTILPGASATVTGKAPETASDGLSVPETALVFDADRSVSVMVFTPDEDDAETGTVARRPVEIEMRADATAAVTDGLEPEEIIVSAGATMLTDGQRVRRFEGLGN